MSLKNLEALIAASPYPWWQWRVATDELAFNSLKATMLGFPVSEFAGKGYRAFTRLVHPDDLEKTMDAMRKVLYGEAELYQVDYRIADVDGVYHWYMDRGFVVDREESGKPRTIRGIVIDLGKEGAIAGGPGNAYRILADSLRVVAREAKSFITVCASCQRIKAKDKTYVEVTGDLYGLLAEEVSHGLCPDCLNRLYPDLKAKGRLSP